MACFVPFNNRNLDVSFFVFRPTIIFVDELLEALKCFSTHTESLGCIQSSIFASIHGNMIIWYGAWTKKSSENKESQYATLVSLDLTKSDAKDKILTVLSMLMRSTSTMAVIVEYSFFTPFAGESRDGSSAAKFSTGDIISVNAVESMPSSSYPDKDQSDSLSSACLAIFRAQFSKTEGIKSGACLKSLRGPRVVCLYVWKSLQCCYSCILSTDYRRSMIPYFDRRSIGIKYDLFRVLFVSSENELERYKDQSMYAPHDYVLGQEINERGVVQN